MTPSRDIRPHRKAALSAAVRTPFLEIANLHAWYGESHVLHGVEVTVGKARS